MAMYAAGVDICLAPTADSRDTWQATIRHIACEGRCFVLSSCQYVTRTCIRWTWRCVKSWTARRIRSRGGSAIVSPLGNVIAGPLYDAEDLTADLDMDEIPQGRFDLDVVGHYARPDVFRLTVNQDPQPPVRFVGHGDGGS